LHTKKKDSGGVKQKGGREKAPSGYVSQKVEKKKSVGSGWPVEKKNERAGGYSPHAGYLQLSGERVGKQAPKTVKSAHAKRKGLRDSLEIPVRWRLTNAEGDARRNGGTLAGHEKGTAGIGTYEEDGIERDN